MKLYYKEYPGEGKPLIILHGLFGSSKNWTTNAKELSKYRTVFTVDLRNHGDSPHADSHTLEDLVSDLLEFIEDHKLIKPDLLGHSMGGLAALLFALQYPDKMGTLVVVDILPKTYHVNYEKEFSALRMDVSGFASRLEIDRKMAEILPDAFTRQFLQMNLDRNDSGYKWKINVETLIEARNALEIKIGDDLKFTGQSLFILGGKSEFAKEEDKQTVLKHFPSAKIEIIPDAGHYLHYTHAGEFIKIVSGFL